MKLFLDTADTSEIKDLAASGLVDGVTTNPSLIAKSGRDMFEVLAEIARLVLGPISAEVTATDPAGMLEEGLRLASIAENIVVKVPLTQGGLRACRLLNERGIGVNVTLCFSSNQALLAAKAGARFVSPFVGRLDDVGHDGMELIQEIKTIYGNYTDLMTEVLVASVRTPLHVRQAALIGADAATIPAAVFRQMMAHPLTDKGLDAFLADWKKTGQSILKR